MDAVCALSTFMVNGMPDPVRFMSAFGALIQRAAESVECGSRRIAIFGEGVQVLCQRSNAKAAIEIEKLCNQLVKEYKDYNIDILCAYSHYAAEGVMHGDILLQQVSAEHSDAYSW